MDDLQKPALPKERKHAYFAAQMRASGDRVMCRIDLCDYGGMLNLCAATKWDDVTGEDGEPTGDLSGDFLAVHPNDLDTESVIWSIWALEVYGG